MLNQGRYKESYKFYTKALSINKGEFKEDQANLAMTYFRRGQALTNLGNKEAGLLYYKKALTLLKGIKDKSISEGTIAMIKRNINELSLKEVLINKNLD